MLSGRVSISAIIGFSVILALLVVVIFAPFIAPYSGFAVLGDVWELPSKRFIFGTDNIGRDLLSRMIYGSQITIFIAAAATALAFFIGVFLGLMSAILGGIFDSVVSRLVDIIMCIPSLILALVVLSALPSTMPILICLIGLLDSTRVYRLARALAVEITVLEFVEVARLRGERTYWILVHEILPNALLPIVSELGLRFIYAVLMLSSLSFLGLGVQPPHADWGAMVRENRAGIVFGIPAAIMPAGAIAALAISVNLVVDWFLSKTGQSKDVNR